MATPITIAKGIKSHPSCSYKCGTPVEVALGDSGEIR